MQACDTCLTINTVIFKTAQSTQEIQKQWIRPGSSSTGRDSPPPAEDIWQHWEPFLIVMTGRVGAAAGV